MKGEPFGALSDGRGVDVWTIGREGGPVADTAYLGAIIGRYANRIRDGRFRLDDADIQVSLGGRPHMLHGGETGFDRAVWRADPDGDALILRHTSPDGDQGFPGRLDVTIRYAIEAGGLVIDYMATTDAPTVLNLTNHAYFNLEGAASGGTILDHELSLHADRFTPVDSGLIPTGELANVEGTPFDFRAPRRIGDRIDAGCEQLALAGGYDHNFVLTEPSHGQPRLAARLTAGGLVMDVLTTQPGIQFYSGNFLPEAGWPHRQALCLETQHFPDSPNRPEFPPTLLRPEDTFRSRTVYQFTPS
jgi:aldose 1-epimerase